MAQAEDLFRFIFNPKLIDQVSDYDVIMAYELLMRRLPENSAVIKLKQQMPMDEMVLTFFDSDEFRDGTIIPLRTGACESWGGPPTRQQIDWLTSCIDFDEPDRLGLETAASREQFFRRLLRAGGLVIEGPGLEPADPVATRDARIARKLRQVSDLVAEIQGLLQTPT